MAGARAGSARDVTIPAARTLAADVDAIRTRALPAPVLERASELFVDYLGVTLAGAVEESTIAVRRGIAHLGTQTRQALRQSRRHAPLRSR